MIPEGFLLGLSTGTYCLTACAPVALPFLFAEDGGMRKNASLVGLFLAGRLAAYLAVGYLLGALGAYAAGFVSPAITHATLRVSGALSGAVLLVAGIARGFEGPKLCEMAHKAFKPAAGALIIGLATGVSLCPPFIAAATRVFGGAASDGPSGALFFLAFFVGTAVWFIPLFGVPLASSRLPTVKKVVRMAMVMLGAYYLLVVGALGTT